MQPRSAPSPCVALTLWALACACGPLPAEPERQGRAPALCSAPATAIADLQGRESTSPLLGAAVEVLGTVTLANPGNGSAPGFFLQSEHPDGDEQTSEGLFVEAGAALLPAAGQRVRVHGRVAELDGVTALTSVELLQACGRADATPLPVAALATEDVEPLENMWLTSGESWTLLEGAAARELSWVSAEGLLYGSGHELGVNSSARAARSWTLRSSTSHSSASDASGLRRGASARLPAVVVQLQGGHRELLATAPVAFEAVTPAPPPAPGPRRLRFAAFNLDNYFVQLGSLGARSAEELARQRDGLVEVLLGLGADVVGLVELENDANLALDDLVLGLNQRLDGEQRYVTSRSTPGPDSTLRAAILWRPSRVEALTEAWFESSSSFRRAPVFQTFALGARALTLGVLHLKSKRCGVDPEVEGAEGCGADTRKEEADALVRSLEALPAQGPRLLLGDFNSDALEAPARILGGAGLVNLLSKVPLVERYSYVFEGRASLLDQAWGSADLADALDLAGIWHVDADEPAPEPAPRAGSGPPRASDHDPVYVDLAF